MPRLSALIPAALEVCWLVLALLTQAIFNPMSIRVFEPEKVAFVRTVAMVMAGLWAFHALVNRGERYTLPMRRVPLLVPVSALLLCYLASAMLSDLPAVSLLGSYRRQFGAATYLALGAIFLFVATYLRSDRQARRLVLAIALGSLIPCIYAISQKLGVDPIPWSVDNSRRVVGTLGQPTFLGAYLACVIPASLWLLLDAGSLRRRLPLVGLLGVEMLALLFSQSRGAWAGALVGIGVVAAVTSRSRLQSSRNMWMVAGGAVMMAVSIVAMNLPGSPLGTLARSVPYLERLATLGDFDSGSGRVRSVIWGAIPAIAAERPILGHGPDMMGYAFERHYPPELAYAENRTASADQAHNVLMQQFVSTGILGLVAYLWLIGAVLVAVQARRPRSPQGAGDGRDARAPRSSPYQALLMGCLAAGLVEGMVGVTSTSATLLFWLYLGLAAALAGRHLLSPRSGDERPAVPGDEASGMRTTLKASALLAAVPPRHPAFAWGFGTLAVALVVFGIARLSVLPLVADVRAAEASGLAAVGRFEEARGRWQEAIALNSDPEYLLLFGQMATEAAEASRDPGVGRWLGEAEGALASAERANPLDLDVALAQGRLHQDRAALLGQGEEWGRAEASFRRAVALSPNRSYVRNRLGALFQAEGQHSEAIQAFRESLRLDPSYAATYGFLGDSLGASGSLVQAVDAYRKAADLDPSLVLVHINLAELYLRLGNRVEAGREYEMAIRLAPSDPALSSRLTEIRWSSP